MGIRKGITRGQSTANRPFMSPNPDKEVPTNPMTRSGIRLRGRVWGRSSRWNYAADFLTEGLDFAPEFPHIRLSRP